MSAESNTYVHTEKSSRYLKGFIAALRSATIPSKAKSDITADYWNKWAFVAWERAVSEDDAGIRDQWLRAADHCLANIDRPSWTPAQITEARIRIAQGDQNEARTLLNLILGVQVSASPISAPAVPATPDIAAAISGTILKMVIDRNAEAIADAVRRAYGPIPSTAIQSIADSLAGKVDVELLGEILKYLLAV